MVSHQQERSLYHFQEQALTQYELLPQATADGLMFYSAPRRELRAPRSGRNWCQPPRVKPLVSCTTVSSEWYVRGLCRQKHGSGEQGTYFKIRRVHRHVENLLQSGSLKKPASAVKSKLWRPRHEFQDSRLLSRWSHDKHQCFVYASHIAVLVVMYHQTGNQSRHASSCLLCRS